MEIGLGFRWRASSYRRIDIADFERITEAEEEPGAVENGLG
jgi:hypothetical protein